MSVTLRLYLIAAATIFVVVACQRVPLTSPTGSTITLSVDRNVLPLNGETAVRAVVIESSGTPVHNGTVVNFSTTLGSMNPPEAKTVNGIAMVTFSAGSISGSAVIRAFSGGATSSNTSGAEVKIGAAAASGNISVSATPPQVSQSGGTVTISAIVFDQSSNVLPGVQVQFTASNGALSSTTGVTDGNGVARTTLSTTQTSTVTAFAGSAKGEVVVTVSAPPTVTVDAPTNGVAGDPVAITVKVPVPAAGTAPRQIAQVVVDLGDGTLRTFTNVTADVSFTHVYRNAGGYTITATARDVNGNTSISSDSIVINFASQPTVSLTASPNPVSMTTASGTTPAAVTVLSITAAAGGTTGSSGAPVRSVRVTAPDGTLIYSNSNAVSSVTVPYRFATGTQQGNYTFTATVTDANSQTSTATSTVIVTP
ncbi:MAG TPA: Ig-like domain-containing protein [Vicinamibacterales bacterium]|nr:Ig-like domain-containing protein [Vicinamibacterales bacterium]